MSDCPHCAHPLRNHRIVKPVYDQVAWFRCACGCQVDGTLVSDGTSE